MHYTLFVWTRGDGRAVATAGRQALAARRLLTIKQAKADARHGHARKAMVYSPHIIHDICLCIHICIHNICIVYTICTRIH